MKILCVCLTAMLVSLSLAPLTASAVEPELLEKQFGYSDDTVYTVPTEELMRGCPRVDCIPAIDQPEFISADAVDFIADDDLVLALEIEGDARAYPMVIMDRHEIVNDEVGGVAVAITWCPLCGSGLVFARNVGEQRLDFGVSGYLHNSDLVMYDRQTRSLWGQISGEAIAGPLAGKTLNQIQATITEWAIWREAHPDTRALSTNTGSGMRYQGSAYTDYEKSDQLMFPVKIREFGIHPKTVVFGLQHNDEALAVIGDHLQDHSPITTELGGEAITISLAADGIARAETAEGAAINTTRLFWFGWLNFNPETRLIPEA